MKSTYLNSLRRNGEFDFHYINLVFWQDFSKWIQQDRRFVESWCILSSSPCPLYPPAKPAWLRHVIWKWIYKERSPLPYPMHHPRKPQRSQKISPQVFEAKPWVVFNGSHPTMVAIVCPHPRMYPYNGCICLAGSKLADLLLLLFERNSLVPPNDQESLPRTIRASDTLTLSTSAPRATSKISI